MLFDSHAHLNSEKLINNVDEILMRAKNNGVNKIICVGYDYDSSILAIDLANQYDEIYAAIGIHPSEARTFDIDLTWMDKYFSNPKVVAIGEIGLDYYWDKTYIEEQKQLLINQIKVANKHKLPIIIHMRDALQDTFEIIKKYKNIEGLGVMHCYSGSKEAMQQFIDLNMYISLAGPVTFKNARVPKEVAKDVPLNKLLVETDSPYLSPEPYRGKTNESKNVLYIAREIAKIKNISLKEVEDKTYFNTCKLFNINCNEVK